MAGVRRYRKTNGNQRKWKIVVHLRRMCVWVSECKRERLRGSFAETIPRMARRIHCGLKSLTVQQWQTICNDPHRSFYFALLFSDVYCLVTRASIFFSLNFLELQFSRSTSLNALSRSRGRAVARMRRYFSQSRHGNSFCHIVPHSPLIFPSAFAAVEDRKRQREVKINCLDGIHVNVNAAASEKDTQSLLRRRSL